MTQRVWLSQLLMIIIETIGQVCLAVDLPPVLVQDVPRFIQFELQIHMYTLK